MERMSTNPTDMLASIPARDETIRLALVDIERQLNAWAAAIANCAYTTESPAEMRQTSPSAVAAPAPDAARVDAPSESEQAVEAIESPAPLEVEATVDDAASTDGGSYGEAVDEEQIETPISRPANPDDDNSVLEGLSPESAKAIKVQWRLLEGTKSLRQLVEEHKARLARGDNSRDGKRSWWSRGKG